MRLLYKWVADVQIVEGFNRCCIYDLTRKEFYLAPLEIKKLVEKVEKSETLKGFSSVEMEWLDFFLSKEYIVKIPENLWDGLVPIGLKWDSVNIIASAVIMDSKHIKECLDFVESKICKNVLIYTKDAVGMNDILENLMQNRSFQDVEFVLQDVDVENVGELLKKFPVVSNVYSDSSNFNTSLSIGGYGNILRMTNSILKYLKVDLNTFLESQENNIFHSRRIQINESGMIFHQNKYLGSIFNSSEVSSWINMIGGVSKQEIDICCHCEFRFMCVDSRIPVMNKNGTFYYETECDYNPFISKWMKEENYKSLAEIGVVVNKEGTIINYSRVSKINRELWGE